jgi:hypothetical protein
MTFAFLVSLKEGRQMFRIRESNVDMNPVYLWIDGRIENRDLASFRNILNRYLSLEKKVVINLANLRQAGWEVKKFLQEIKDRVELVDLPEHMRTTWMGSGNDRTRDPTNDP